MIKRAYDADGAGAGAPTYQYWVYDDSINAVLQFDGAAASNLAHRYLWANDVDALLADEQVTSLGSGGNTLWGLSDNQGSLRDIADLNESTGVTSVTNHRTYNSFGKLTSETNAAVDLFFGYTGKFLDDATGYQNNVNRWYDSNLGQWFNEDPSGFDAGDANLRRYVTNSPLNQIDPTGLDGYPGGPGSVDQSEYIHDVEDNQSFMAYASAMYGAGMQSMADSAATPWRYAQAYASEAIDGPSEESKAMYENAYRKSPYGQTENDYYMHEATKWAWYTAFTSAEMLLQAKLFRVGISTVMRAKDYSYGKKMFELAQDQRQVASSMEKVLESVNAKYRLWGSRFIREAIKHGDERKEVMEQLNSKLRQYSEKVERIEKQIQVAKNAVQKALELAYTSSFFRDGLR